MRQIVVVGEDALTCAIGDRLVGEFLPGWSLAVPPIDKAGVTKLVAALPRYVDLARKGTPVLCIADLDRAPCPLTLLRRWLPATPVPDLVLRIAVTEAESWVLADRLGCASFLNAPASTIPRELDQLPDPKAVLLNLARRYAPRALRSEIVAERGATPGAGYNAHVTRFVRRVWQPTRAVGESRSLARAVNRIREMGARRG